MLNWNALLHGEPAQWKIPTALRVRYTTLRDAVNCKNRRVASRKIELFPKKFRLKAFQIISSN